MAEVHVYPFACSDCLWQGSEELVLLNSLPMPVSGLGLLEPDSDYQLEPIKHAVAGPSITRSGKALP